jgi:Domain of unknown function (DUF4148)
MKSILFAAAVVASSISLSAFAQTQTTEESAPTTARVASNDTVAPGAQWVPPNGQPTEQKTRAQVYQELVQAERDGQMAYLNSTVYAHP